MGNQYLERTLIELNITVDKILQVVAAQQVKIKELEQSIKALKGREFARGEY